MLQAKHLLFKFVVVCGLGILTACQPAASPPPAATVAPAPATAPATATPTPQPSPTPIQLSALQTFTHASQRFSIDYPPDWQVFPQDNGVIVLEPGGQFGYTVVFDDVGRPYNAKDFSHYVAAFVTQNFTQNSSNFKALSYVEQDDGSVTARFSVDDPKLGPTINQLEVRQQDTVIFVVYTSARQTQWPAVQAPLETLAASLTLLKAPSEATGATPTPPVWTLTGPTSKEFGFLVASNWKIIAQDEHSITVSSPEEDMQFTASNFPWPGALSNPKAATEAALAHVKELKNQYADVQYLPPTEFPLDTATGATIDFVYTNTDNETMAGSVITAVGNGKMHKIVFSAPTNLYDLALEWFNPMYKSFKFLEPEKGLTEDEK